MKARPRILFLLVNDNQSANQVLAGMGRLGCECALMSPPGFTCALSRFVSHRFEWAQHCGFWILRVRSGLERAMREWRPDLIVPLDDVAAWLLRGLVRGSRPVSPELHRVLETSLGSPSGYDAICSRARFLGLAKQIGVRTPASRAVGRATALETAGTIGYPLLLKVEQSPYGGGAGVKIAGDQGQLSSAILAASQGRCGSLSRGKQAVRRILWRLAGIRPVKPLFELQQYIMGEGTVRVVAAWQGRVLSGVSFEKLCVNPQPFGATTVFRATDHPEMEEAVRKVVAELSYSGFAHFDFVIEKDSGRAFMIEMNPYPPGFIHLGGLAGHDVCGAMARQLGGLPETAGVAALPEQTPIVRFPFELLRDPESPWLRAGSRVFHDIPWDDPAVLETHYNWLLRQHPFHAVEIARVTGIEDRAEESAA